MWENQLAGVGIFWGQIQKVVQLSKLGFPTSNPSLMVNSLDHGLEAPCHETRNRARSFTGSAHPGKFAGWSVGVIKVEVVGADKQEVAFVCLMRI